MKTLHLTFGFPPDPPGGTELYVAALCRDLAARGVDSVVVAPGRRDDDYRYQGLRVRRFAIDHGDLDLAALYGDGDAQAAAAFGRILDNERPDLVHQHALTAACSLRLARRVKALGLPLVFTYHTPTTSCQRGTLLKWGSAQCDGSLDTAPCAACTLEGLGAGRTTSRIFARTPDAADTLLGKAGLHGGPWTALRMPGLTRRHHDAVREFFGLVDRFVALTPWVRALLVANGVPPASIVDCPHGLLNGPAERRPVGDLDAGPLRIAHFGRLDPVKGTELLVRAVRAIPDAPLRLDIFGIVQSEADAGVLKRLTTLSGSDARVRMLASIDHALVAARLTEYDLVAVPSQWMETGPLVLLEAFASGVPVVGSDLGGIADKIADGQNGVLVRPYNSVAAWSAALARLCTDRDLPGRLARGIRPVRPSLDVARDMVNVYNELLTVSAAPMAAQVSGRAVTETTPVPAGVR